MYLDNKRVFLAGATGSVGTAILAHLIERYPAVRIRAAVHTTKPLFAQDRVEYVSGDLRSPETCRVMARGCDCAIMAASRSGGSKTMTQEPWLFLNDNIAMNTALLEAFYHEQVRRVIFIGSSTVYQEFDGFVRESVAIKDLVQKMIALSGKELSINFDTAKPTIIDAWDDCGTACPGNVGKMGKIGIACSTSNARLIKTKLCLDNAKAFAELGWKPAIALEEGIRSTLEWYRTHAAAGG